MPSVLTRPINAKHARLIKRARCAARGERGKRQRELVDYMTALLAGARRRRAAR